MKILAKFALIVLFISIRAQAVTLVQHSNVRCASATTCAITISSVASGDTLIAFVAGTFATFTSLVDSNGTVSTGVAWANLTTVGAGIYYVLDTASGTHTLTLTAASGNLEILVAEYSGMPTSGAFDVGSAVAHGSSATPASASITPAGNNELLVGLLDVAGASVTFSGWGSSLTQVDTQPGGSSSAWAAVVQTTGVSGSASATASASANWSAVAAFFKPASGSSCTTAGITEAGAFAVPTASSTVMRLKNGSFGTVDCSTVSYRYQGGNFGTN